MTLNKKEQGLLKDLQNEEKLCVEKYRMASEKANDPQLKEMFSQISQEEQQHYNTVTQMLGGTVPAENTAQPKNRRQPKTPQQLKSTASRAGKQQDQYLLNDLLATEKFIAGNYNISVFEFSDEAARHALNAIQSQEQHHGKQLSEYMQANGMYC